MTAKEPLILVTNDDGYFADGIIALERRLRGLGQTVVVAPDRERSATSLALTLQLPLRVREVQKDIFAVDGTPADCVYLAMEKLLPRKPDLVVSGINHGPNLGQQDVSYSGTVAGAIQGTYFGIPSLAVSHLPSSGRRFHFDFASEVACKLAEKLIEFRLPSGITLSLNIPPPPAKGFKLTRLGWKVYSPEIIDKEDPRHSPYYWIGLGNPKSVGDEETDLEAVKQGYIALTPIHTDLTHYELLGHPLLKKIVADTKLETK